MLENKHYTVLLLSAPIGSGHIMAAEAIADVLRQDINITVVHGNIFSFFPGFIGKGFLKTYLWMLAKCPWMYALAYKWGNKNGGGSLWLRAIINRFLTLLGNSYLNSVKPDAVISTHATPAGIISIYKEKHPTLWQGAVITDYTIHRWWLNSGIDTYFIADERLKNKISTTGEIFATGIPIRKEFLMLPDRNILRDHFNWSAEETVCLLVGGGEGLLTMEDIIQSLLEFQNKQLRLVAITGKNEKLANKLTARFQEHRDSIEIYRFRQDMPELMAAADMIISKAGGLTSAEILATNLEYIIYKPLPGQEQGNANFLAENYSAYIANDITELNKHVGELLTQQQLSGANRYGRPEAVKKICEVVKTHLQ